jgi:hypothetical protein
VIAPITYWNSTQAFVSVPEKSGVLAFNGLVYIAAAGGKKSPGAAFGFRPTIDVQRIPITFNSGTMRLASPFISVEAVNDKKVKHWMGDNWTAAMCFCGAKGDDEVYFHGESLKNGWQVDGVDVWYYEYGSPGGVGNGAASVVEIRPGTVSKYVRFHWWIGYLAQLDYGAWLVVSGPKGLPPE